MLTFFIIGHINHRKKIGLLSLLLVRSLFFGTSSLLSLHRALHAKIRSESKFVFPNCTISDVVDNCLTERSWFEFFGGDLFTFSDVSRCPGTFLFLSSSLGRSFHFTGTAPFLKVHRLPPATRNMSSVRNHSCLGYTETVFPRLSRHTVFPNSTKLFILCRKCKKSKACFFFPVAS